MNALFKSAVVTLVVCLPVISNGQNYVLVSSVIGSGAVQGSSTNFELQGTVGEIIGAGSSTNFEGGWGFWYTLSGGGVSGGVLANLQLLLEGPYISGGNMNAGIQRSEIPESQPFNTAPWNYGGSESVASGFFSSNTDVVDWVYIQVRANSPAPTSPPMTPLASRAALLKTDGTVVDTDGTSPVSFPTLSDGTYYIVVDHRNHIRAMSASGVASSSSTLTYDFTDALTKSYTGGPPPVAFLETGQYGLFAGDGNGDGQAIADDFNSWLVDTKAGKTGYILSDYDLNNSATAGDFNLWLVNTKSGASSQVPNP